MIEFREVSKIYPDGTAALQKVSFGLNPGEFVFLVGPSGAGKTTLLKLLIREEHPTEGQIIFGEQDLTKLHPKDISQVRRDIGVVFQDFKLLPYKSAFENVALALEVTGREHEIPTLVPYYLSLVGLEGKERHFPHELSGGERQRAALARALISDPKVIVADEPTGFVDPAQTWSIFHILEKINKLGTTLLVATHAAEIVNSLGKRVVAIEKGRVVRDVKKGTYRS